MISRKYFGVFLLLVFDRSLGFSYNNVQKISTSSRVNMGYAIIEDDDWYQMQSAQECAFSDTCSLEDAKKSFDNVMRIQSNCASGNVNSSVCDNVATSAEIVALLRQKIEKKLSTLKSISNLSTISLASIVCLSAFVVAGVTGNTPMNPDVIPFTPQEWLWAARDGYLPTMVEQYFKYGGLSNVDNYYDIETLPFTLQELWWSIKGGYLNNMIEHYFKNGGLLSSNSESTFLTEQEWYWSIRDGYFGEIVKHNFQHGGVVSTLDYQCNDEVIPMTPEEIKMAFQDGYIDDMISHNFRNGGL